MPRPTIAEALDRMNRAEARADVLSLAVHDMATGRRPDAEARLRPAEVGLPSDEPTYLARLYRADGPTGGYVVIRARLSDGRFDVQTVGFDAWRADARDMLATGARWALAHSVLADRLAIALREARAIAAGEVPRSEASPEA
jgi:hypothetical protein